MHRQLPSSFSVRIFWKNPLVFLKRVGNEGEEDAPDGAG